MFVPVLTRYLIVRRSGLKVKMFPHPGRWSDTLEIHLETHEINKVFLKAATG